MTQTGAILVTLAIEIPIAVALVAARGWAPGKLGLVAVSSLAASVLTHPILWMVDPVLAPALPDRTLRLALLESLIVVVEAVVYGLGAGLPPRRALAVSFVANAASLGAGILIYAL